MKECFENVHKPLC
uniref:Uncharacterized protein n=1 Tax=Anguilla anguilla TaxID=7936 RepID=A0A0E9SQ07_ANGAN